MISGVGKKAQEFVTGHGTRSPEKLMQFVERLAHQIGVRKLRIERDADRYVRKVCLPVGLILKLDREHDRKTAPVRAGEYSLKLYRGDVHGANLADRCFGGNRYQNGAAR